MVTLTKTTRACAVSQTGTLQQIAAPAADDSLKKIQADALFTINGFKARIRAAQRQIRPCPQTLINAEINLSTAANLLNGNKPTKKRSQQLLLELSPVNVQVVLQELWNASNSLNGMYKGEPGRLSNEIFDFYLELRKQVLGLNSKDFSDAVNRAWVENSRPNNKKQ
jgi:hypothetical protein